MTTKEKLVVLLQNSGYDTITACKEADTCIKSVRGFFKDSQAKKTIRLIGGYAVTFNRPEYKRKGKK